jgi:hypothetical protein
MFKRKQTPADEPVFQSRTTASTPAAPVLPADPAETVAEGRTTCYPQDADPPPPVVGQSRTTVYRQAVRWNRGGYDTIN